MISKSNQKRFQEVTERKKEKKIEMDKAVLKKELKWKWRKHP